MGTLRLLSVVAARVILQTDWKDLAHRACVKAGAYVIAPRRKP